MVFLHLFIVNKSGGLVYNRPLSAKAPKISTNEFLRIGSTFHSLHAIAAEASPVKLPNGKNACTSIIIGSDVIKSGGNQSTDVFVLSMNSAAGADDGIEKIVAGGMELRCLQTMTGIKFVITSEPSPTVDLDVVLKEIYVLYAECVCKGEFVLLSSTWNPGVVAKRSSPERDQCFFFQIHSMN